ncbi:TetR/AcrR family transcriptional regulator [Cellulomonas taurus]|uniref:TetR/AcrR family transcriptional regulator n=1 Tax=Cellulomonas taurus TaxID=2729175 RepID=UPI00145D50F4|nr:TetR/AcrR family transcriptional regulator [Cellulomonas taurus]
MRTTSTGIDPQPATGLPVGAVGAVDQGDPARGASLAGEALPTSPVAAKILAAASRLFYAEGIRAVSADRVIAAATVSKVTFYRHFGTKDDLVVAYLRAIATGERAAVDQVRAAHPDDPVAVLRHYADSLDDQSCRPGFRGCAFINAAAEYADAAHPVRAVVAEHRAWLTDTARALLDQAGARDPEQAALELVLLRDGAMVAGYAGSAQAGAALRRAGRAVLDAHGVALPE